MKLWRTTLAILFICTCRPASAQVEQPAAGGQPTANADKPPKQPPTPLFRRHHRGLYRNEQGDEVIDGTPQSPPLETDDPNVPDQGEWEVNLTTLADFSSASQHVDVLLVDANYGLILKLAGQHLPAQLKFEFPMSGVRPAGDPFTFGVGAATAGVKVDCYINEHTGMALAIYPQLEFAMPGGVEKDLADPGQRVIVPVLLSKEFHFLIVVANGGIEAPINNPDGDLTIPFGVGVGRALTRKIAAMFEVRGETPITSGGKRQWFVNVGGVRSVGHVIVYANLGRSLESSDDLTHTYFGWGIKMMGPSSSSNTSH